MKGFKYTFANKDNKGHTKGLFKKKVRCLNNGIVYNSLEEAAEELSISQSSISRIINGKTLSCKGLKFEKINQ